MQRIKSKPGNPPAIGSEIRDVQDSPAFRNLFHDQPNPYNLIFGIYIDFYSVFKMKIAGEFKPNETENYHLQLQTGKKASCGLICPVLSQPSQTPEI